MHSFIWGSKKFKNMWLYKDSHKDNKQLRSPSFASLVAAAKNFSPHKERKELGSLNCNVQKDIIRNHPSVEHKKTVKKWFF
jgi:hypothetical protein